MLASLDSEEWKALLALSKYPAAHVKLSAGFRVSSLPYPHQDLKQAVQVLVEAYGASRLMWGSDFPWVTEQEGGYAGALGVLDGVLDETSMDHILSKTACALFPELL